MTDASNPPKSPTLLPPRKSVELEDPGAHDLGVLWSYYLADVAELQLIYLAEASASETEDDVFADAPEGQGSHSRPSSPIPITRVEKVDDRESHGEVPGTAAYNMRMQDAVPDELEVIPEGSGSRPSSRADQQANLASPGGMPIPKTVVEKVDPAAPSHGDVPGTAAHAIRKADAVPDAILKAPENQKISGSESVGDGITPEIPIPRTVVTRVDSEPAHGEVPDIDAFSIRQGDAEPDVVEKKGDVSSASPIAADGGFGPMDDEESEDESAGTDNNEANDDIDAKADEGFGDDFDDFEAGAENEDFGDFDDGFQQASASDEEGEETEPPAPSIQSLPPSTSLFPLLDFSELDALDDIIAATSPYLDEMFPSTKETYPPAPDQPSNRNSIFLTDRSLSLWSQLVAPPPLQPPNWVRSRIRRLFLVSLGVPVDLDEILPASKQKKLILPSIHLRSDSQSPPEGRRPGSRVRLKQDNTSSASVDHPSTAKASRKRKGPPSPPDLDLQAIKMLCATTDAALSNMTDSELRAHVNRLEELTTKASEVLEYWLKRRASALEDKEAFEGVIENLVKHARRVRK
ncbi:hypothetical protein OEA41_007071 [Lepraria neglecta]|uniref:Uncharacterized protein n=1 Tax=Lepraria neglecta TaxID=209136 RepID=A0AAE0DL08_9LECA|nr:hypothetical protein OEA41_007071 [Lepraria neglecta]